MGTVAMRSTGHTEYGEPPEPPHSPESERYLPRYSEVLSKIYEVEENPFDALRRGSATSEESSPTIATSASSLWSRPSTSASSSSSPQPQKTITTTRPPLFTSHTCPISLGTYPELEDAAYESILYLEAARTYRLQGSFIYTSQTCSLPRYQLQRS
jgi:hypothetical protein